MGLVGYTRAIALQKYLETWEQATMEHEEIVIHMPKTKGGLYGPKAHGPKPTWVSWVRGLL